MTSAPKSFEEFWPVYVAQHSRAGTRAWHFAGSTLALVCLAGVAAGRSLLPVAAAMVLGYGFAWIGHFFVERNQPATFRHPLWSLRGDARMYLLMLAGRMHAEVERIHGTDTKRSTNTAPHSEGVSGG